MITTENKMIWTIEDAELLIGNDKFYEIINGELYIERDSFMTRAPRWEHQKAIGRINRVLENWSLKTNLGETIISPGLVFGDTDNVIPDLVWISKDKLVNSIDESGHLTHAPELIVEVLSYGENDVKRDKEAKLKLYSVKGVKEYWIVDWKAQEVTIYHRNNAQLELVYTLFSEDTITSEFLPQFSLNVKDIFI
jgi:Uma2 family endonuclease